MGVTEVAPGTFGGVRFGGQIPPGQETCPEPMEVAAGAAIGTVDGFP
jgi:hypothetical protein